MGTITWLIPQVLGGAPCPTLQELEGWKVLGVSSIMNLIAEPYVAEVLQQEKGLGFDVYHFPIRDFSAPDSTKDMDEAVGWLDQQQQQGKTTLIHCLGGIGRTSTVFIAFLVHHGVALQDAFAQVSRLGISPQSPEQFFFLEQYVRFLSKRKSSE